MEDERLQREKDARDYFYEKYYTAYQSAVSKLGTRRREVYDEVGYLKTKYLLTSEERMALACFVPEFMGIEYDYKELEEERDRVLEEYINMSSIFKIPLLFPNEPLKPIDLPKIDLPKLDGTESDTDVNETTDILKRKEFDERFQREKDAIDYFYEKYHTAYQSAVSKLNTRGRDAYDENGFLKTEYILTSEERMALACLVPEFMGIKYDIEELDEETSKVMKGSSISSSFKIPFLFDGPLKPLVLPDLRADQRIKPVDLPKLDQMNSFLLENDKLMEIELPNLSSPASNFLLHNVTLQKLTDMDDGYLNAVIAYIEQTSPEVSRVVSKLNSKKEKLAFLKLIVEKYEYLELLKNAKLTAKAFASLTSFDEYSFDLKIEPISVSNKNYSSEVLKKVRKETLFGEVDDSCISLLGAKNKIVQLVRDTDDGQLTISIIDLDTLMEELGKKEIQATLEYDRNVLHCYCGTKKRGSTK